MTIMIDNRAGSYGLAPLLTQRRLPVELCRMEFGDIAWQGKGPEGRPVTVGIEYKKVPDVLQCITNGRFAGHQLPGLLKSFEVVWLLVEGRFRPSHSDGTLQLWKRKGVWESYSQGQRGFMYRELVAWLLTLTAKAGIHVGFTDDNYETAAWVAASYGWWTGKEWEEHRSHLAMNESQLITPTDRVAMLTRPSIVRRIASQLPGIGWEKSQWVAAKFGSVEEMVLAEEEEWTEIAGIGKETARKCRKALGCTGA